MGSDDLFKISKAKRLRKITRDIDKKESYEKFLIVSEDTKSSYTYLKEAILHYRIQSANFAIVGLGKDPLDIVNEAEARYNKESASHHPDFDRVFCVFDRDTHTRYFNALSKIDALNKKIAGSEPTFIGITSDPCFELWLILHFTYTTKLYLPTQKKSASNIVYDDLCNIYPTYKKSSFGIFKNLLPKLDDAIDNAKKLKSYCTSNGAISPLTRLDELLVYLRDIKLKK
jgi:hypothetical protein